MKPLWLMMRSTGVNVPETERKTFSGNGFSTCITVSAFSCNYGSLLATGDDT